MILEDILCDVKDSLESLGYFGVIYEYAEMTKTKTEGGVLMYPKAYVGAGNYVDVYDLEPNSCYIRKRREVEMEDLEDTTMSCDSNFISLNYPMRIVGAVSKEMLEDNAFSDDKMVYEILSVLGGKVSNIGNTKSVNIKPTKYETDRSKVWKDEISGMDEIININLTYFYIDFEIRIETKRTCLTDVCYG